MPLSKTQCLFYQKACLPSEKCAAVSLSFFSSLSLLLMYRVENSYPYPKGFISHYSLMVRLRYLFRTKKIQHQKRSYGLLPRHRHAHWFEYADWRLVSRIPPYIEGYEKKKLHFSTHTLINKGWVMSQSARVFCRLLENFLRPTEN